MKITLKQRFTLIEIFLILWFLFVIGLAGGALYTIIHFINKFW